MTHLPTNTYTLKREILSFAGKISRRLPKPNRKFTADISYGMLASGSCLLTDITDHLHETSKKVHSVERLIRHLNKRHSHRNAVLLSFPHTQMGPFSEPVIYIDDSDVVKPDGRKFEALGLVRDGSKNTDSKNVYEKGSSLFGKLPLSWTAVMKITRCSSNWRRWNRTTSSA